MLSTTNFTLSCPVIQEINQAIFYQSTWHLVLSHVSYRHYVPTQVSYWHHILAHIL